MVVSLLVWDDLLDQIDPDLGTSACCSLQTSSKISARTIKPVALLLFIDDILSGPVYLYSPFTDLLSCLPPSNLSIFPTSALALSRLVVAVSMLLILSPHTSPSIRIHSLNPPSFTKDTRPLPRHNPPLAVMVLHLSERSLGRPQTVSTEGREWRG